MAFVARTREQIRAAILSAFTSRFAAAGKTLSVESGSHAYFLADALAVELMQTEAAAEALSHEILPDESVELLDHHATVHGVSRRAASAATLSVTVTGTPSSTVSITLPARMSSPSGAVFSCTSASVTLDGLGGGTISVTADEAGSAGSLAIGTVLTWQSAPAGLDPTGEVAEVTTSGEDTEGDDALRARILARIRRRPGSGNAADWIDWGEQCTGVEEVYVYPLLQPGTLSGDTLGCVSIVVLGPAQGDSPTNTRYLANARLAEIKGFIEGTHDADGNTVTDGVQLRPASIASADFEVYRPNLMNVAVSLKLTTTSRYPFAFTGTLAVDTGLSSSTSLVVSGDETAKTGKIALCRVGAAHRGEWQATELKNGVFAAGKTTFTVSLSGAPTTTTAYPAPANWQALREAFFAYFDALGPKDNDSRRVPTEDVQGRATVYLSQLGAVALSVPGVVSCTVVLPASDTPPAETMGLCVLDTFLVTEV